MIDLRREVRPLITLDTPILRRMDIAPSAWRSEATNVSRTLIVFCQFVPRLPISIAFHARGSPSPISAAACSRVWSISSQKE